MQHAGQPKSASQPAADGSAIEALARRDYEACHPGDAFDDLKQRAGFARQDAGLPHAWIGAAQSGRLGPPDTAPAA